MSKVFAALSTLECMLGLWTLETNNIFSNDGMTQAVGGPMPSNSLPFFPPCRRNE